MASSKPDIGAFARNLVVNAFNTLADKVAEAKPGLQRLADSWRDLTDAEREDLASRITAAAKLAAATLPVALGARKRVRKRAKRTTGAAAQAAAKPAEAKQKKKDKKGKKDKKRKKKDKKKGKKKKK
jgi:hypothetical protein